jgi:hypothetical protein
MRRVKLVGSSPRQNVGPGETSSIPTEWISPDGKTMHLLFSGMIIFGEQRNIENKVGRRFFRRPGFQK